MGQLKIDSDRLTVQEQHTSSHITSWFWKCVVLYMIAFQGAVFLFYFDMKPFKVKTAPRKFVGFYLNAGRLGNQMFHMITGYGIARTMNRVHYLPYGRSRAHVEKYLVYLERIFPRLRQTYVLAKNGTKERSVPFARSCCTYYDPKRLSNLTDQFLLLRFRFGQNPRYFEDYIVDVRSILKFSEEVKQNGSQLLHSLKNYSESMCIHVRRGDFVRRRISTDMNTTVKAANRIAKKMNISHFMIFGDDRKFMTNMSRYIVNTGGWENDLRYSTIELHFDNTVPTL